MAHSHQVSRLNIIPHISNLLNDEDRYVPLKSLVGPFEFPMTSFRRKLQAGNQAFGDFAKYDSDPFKSVTAFCHKKLMDIMLYLFERLRGAPQRLVAKRVFCLVRLKAAALAENKDAEWIRSRGDLAEAYSAVEAFSFFIEVEKKTDGHDVEDDVMMDFNDLDDIIQNLYKHDEAGAKAASGGGDGAKKRKRVIEGFLAGRNHQGASFNIDKDSSDLSEVISSNFVFGQTMCGAISNFRVFDGDQQKDLRDLSYSPSRVFNMQALWERCEDHGNPEERRLPREFIAHTELHGPCVDLCKGLSFGVLIEDFKRNLFGYLGFPDIRKRREDYNIPVPDDDTMTAVVDLALDMSVQTAGVSSFLVTRDRLSPSREALVQACQNSEISKKEKFDMVNKWKGQALVPFKSVFNERSSIAYSIKKMVAEWEHANEKDHGPGKEGIPIKSVTVKSYPNLDRQSDYLAALYEFAELAGFYCHHSIFIAMLIDARHACRKGQERGPHTILYGSPGGGKSRIIEMVMTCMQSEGRNMFCQALSNMSRLSWASVDPSNPTNPETCQAQIAFFWDEVPASFLGAGDTSSRKGEGDDNVALMKEMLSAFWLSWRRNIEVLNKDTTKGRGLEEMQICNEPVFIGGMNRAPYSINPAFRRRVCFKTCLLFERADGETFESVQRRDTETKKDPDRIRWVEGLRVNAKLHLLVAMAEYCNILLPPSLEIWDGLATKFKKEVEKVISVQNFSDRIFDAKSRATLLTRTIAVFETFQSGEDLVLTFDQIVALLPEVEKRSIAGERLCISVLSSLEDVCFPLMHKVILNAIKSKWPDLEDDPVENVYAKNNRSLGRYARLPVMLSRPKSKETVSECASRIVYAELRAIIASESVKYKIDGDDTLAAAAIMELTAIMSPNHPVLVVKENGDQLIEVFISLERLQSAEVSVLDIIKKISKPGTQLLMIPHGSPKLPQFPAYIEDGTADGELADDRAFRKRCDRLFMDASETESEYHHTKSNKSLHVQQTQYPKDRILEVMMNASL